MTRDWPQGSLSQCDLKQIPWPCPGPGPGFVENGHSQAKPCGWLTMLGVHAHLLPHAAESGCKQVSPDVGLREPLHIPHAA